jgi:hypothetical protein
VPVVSGGSSWGQIASEIRETPKMLGEYVHLASRHNHSCTTRDEFGTLDAPEAEAYDARRVERWYQSLDSQHTRDANPMAAAPANTAAIGEEVRTSSRRRQPASS